MSEPVTVACVLKSGSPDAKSSWQGQYTPECVYALRNMVMENLSLPVRFVCLTDVENLECETIPLVNNWQGWWSKIELFRPGLFKGPVLYFDLDTFINRPIDILFDVPGDFVMLRDLYSPAKPASGVMRWEGDYSHIHKFFMSSGSCGYYGDQEFMADLVNPDFFQDHLPEGFIKSFKAGGRGEDLKETPVVCFHGLPKPHDSDGWIKDYWMNKLPST